jgi:hypothetical protein
MPLGFVYARTLRGGAVQDGSLAARRRASQDQLGLVPLRFAWALGCGDPDSVGGAFMTFRSRGGINSRAGASSGRFSRFLGGSSCQGSIILSAPTSRCSKPTVNARNTRKPARNSFVSARKNSPRRPKRVRNRSLYWESDRRKGRSQRSRADARVAVVDTGGIEGGRDRVWEVAGGA